MSRVIVIQQTRHQADVSPAQAYGVVEFILSPSDRPSCDPHISERKLLEVLKSFNSQEDYILWSGGDPLAFFLTGKILGEMGIKKFRYLRYERGDTRQTRSAPYYVPVTITL